MRVCRWLALRGIGCESKVVHEGTIIKDVVSVMEGGVDAFDVIFQFADECVL